MPRILLHQHILCSALPVSGCSLALSPMRRLILFGWFVCLITLLAAASSSTTTTEPKCTSTNYTKNEKMNYPEVGLYSKGMATLMRHMIGDITDDTAEELRKILENQEESHKHVLKILLQHGWILAIFIILILISVGLLIAAIVVFFCRWFKPDKKVLTPAKHSVILTLIAIVFCGVVCASGAFVFFISTSEVKTGIEDIGIQLEQSNSYISEYVGSYEKFMNCTIFEHGIKIEALLIEKKNEMDFVTNKLIAELVYIIAKGDALNEKDTKHLKEVQEIKEELTCFKNQVVDVRKSVDRVVNEAGITIQGSLKNLLEVVVKVREGFSIMEKSLLSLMIDQNFYSGVGATVVQSFFLIPLLLCCALIFSFVMLLLGFNGKCSTSKKKKKMNLISITSSYVLPITGYSAMLIGVVFFAVAAGCFLVAFISMFHCISFFNDPDSLVFSAFPSLTMKVGGSTSHNAVDGCMNEYWFFEAIDVDKNLTLGQLNTVREKMRNQDYGKNFRAFSITDTFFENIGYEANSNSKVKEYHGGLIRMASRAHRDNLILEIDSKLEQLMDDLQQRFLDQMNSVLSVSPRCESMMNIWYRAGGFICNGVSIPSQGTWLPCVVCGFGSLSVSFWLFKAAKLLASDETIVSESSSLEEEIVYRSPDEDREYFLNNLHKFGRVFWCRHKSSKVLKVLHILKNICSCSSSKMCLPPKSSYSLVDYDQFWIQEQTQTSFPKHDKIHLCLPTHVGKKFILLARDECRTTVHYTSYVVATSTQERIVVVQVKSHPDPLRIILFMHETDNDIGDWLFSFPRIDAIANICRPSIVYAVDVAGYGCSTGNPTEASVKASVQAFYAFARKKHPNLPDSSFFVMGVSFGCVGALEISRTHPLGGTILFCPPHSFREVVANMYSSVLRLVSFCINPNHFNCEIKIKEAMSHILLVHGMKDELIPPFLFEKLAKAAPNATVLQIQKAHHSDLFVFREAWEAVEDFVTKGVHCTNDF